MFEDPILEVADLCTYYGTSQALFDASVSAPRTGSIAVLGLNGAGKTTLLKTIVGELSSTRGVIGFDRTDVTQLPTHQRIRRGLGYVPQEHAVFSQLSVRENMMVGSITQTDDSGFDEVIEMYNSLNEDEQTSFATFVNQLEDEEVLAELPNFMTAAGRTQTNQIN